MQGNRSFDTGLRKIVEGYTVQGFAEYKLFVSGSLVISINGHDRVLRSSSVLAVPLQMFTPHYASTFHST